ncbi:MAG: manganese efflux pump [Bacteroidales bacterium]|nr:manganese efflux pump [Bacteroidales bacterium]
MSYIEIFLLAIGLCFDTLAVSMVGGACMGKLSWGQHFKISGSFAIVQALFILLGWALGNSFYRYIESFDHWVAFLLLLFIGGKMVLESLKKESDEAPTDLLNTGKLIISAIATSIDALAVGISFAMLDFSWMKIGWTFIIVAVVTAASSELGLGGGRWLSKFSGKYSNLIGGLILISIGIKILLEHIVG